MIDQAGIMMAQGSTIACERISGVNDNMMKSHYHNYYELYYLEDGERYHMIQDDMYTMKPGELILFSPYILHRSYGDENVPFRRLVLYFHRNEVESQELLEALDSGNGLYHPESRVRQILHQMLETLLREQNDYSELKKGYRHTVLNMLLFAIVLQLHRKKPSPKKDYNRMSQVIGYIHNHYQEDISLEELARRFYISPYYLCREFKRHTNSTVIQYVNITRVMNAQRRFMETDKNITEICGETGFSNLTHFNRVFKSVTGMTPSGYRNTHKNLIGGMGISNEML